MREKGVYSPEAQNRNVDHSKEVDESGRGLRAHSHIPIMSMEEVSEEVTEEQTSKNG